MLKVGLHHTRSALLKVMPNISADTCAHAMLHVRQVGVVNRRGVSQYQQPHMMLKRGLDLLTELFPHYPARLGKAGAVQMDLLQGVVAVSPMKISCCTSAQTGKSWQHDSAPVALYSRTICTAVLALRSVQLEHIRSSEYSDTQSSKTTSFCVTMLLLQSKGR